MRYLIWLCVISVAMSCSSLTSLPSTELKSDYYLYRGKEAAYERVYVDVKDDSTRVARLNGSIIPNEAGQTFLKRGFDADVLVVPFKYRSSSQGFPRQLTTNFNGSIFLGYRVDRFRLHHFKTPLGTVKQYRQWGITAGAFGGIGAGTIAPWTTNYMTNDEYNGFILNRGLAVMMGENNLTVGVGIGWDYLTDRDKDIWIYQNKAWYGLTVSLHLN